MRVSSAIAAALALCLAALPAAAAESGPRHGLSLFGDLKYPSDFKHFDYVNPDAPKGGLVRMADIGSFDSLNPILYKGEAAGMLELWADLYSVTKDPRYLELAKKFFAMRDSRSSTSPTLAPETSVRAPPASDLTCAQESVNGSPARAGPLSSGSPSGTCAMPAPNRRRQPPPFERR